MAEENKLTMDDLVRLYAEAKEDPAVLSLAQTAISEFLGAEASIARASVAEALAFSVMKQSGQK